MPPIRSKWHTQSVEQTWSTTTNDPQKAIEVAAGLCRADYSLRRSGMELALRRLTPQRRLRRGRGTCGAGPATVTDGENLYVVHDFKPIDPRNLCQAECSTVDQSLRVLPPLAQASAPQPDGDTLSLE